MDRRQWLRAARFALAAGLIGFAIWIVASSGGTIEEAWRSAQAAPPWLIAVALALPIANWLVVAVGFWILNGRYAKTRLSETVALIGGAWLLNYLPMRPGMVGRFAYHKKYDGIQIRQSARVLIESMIATAIAGAVMAALALAPLQGVPRFMLLAVPVFAAMCAAALLGRGAGDAWRLAVVLGLRYLDLAVWVARYLAVFAIVGRPLAIEEAVAIALVSHAALLLPIAGNGLGLREWAVGLTAGLLPGSDGQTEIGLAADLVNRGFEVLVAVPVGLVCLGWLARRRNWHRLGLAAGEEASESTDPAQPDRA